jgi:hypothetical protein
MNMRKAISITLSAENLLWLRGQAARTAKGSVSEVLDGIVQQARSSGSAAPGSMLSVAGTIDLPEEDPELENADGYVRALFSASARQPMVVREKAAKNYSTRKVRRG